MNFVFRADASSEIGTGHVMRCLTLAQALKERGSVVHFVCREHDGNLCDLIEQRGFGVYRLPIESHVQSDIAGDLLHANWLGASWVDDAQSTLTAITSLGLKPDWLIVDHYAIDYRWESQLRNSVNQIMVIDDLADRRHECDLLLDQNLVDGMNERYSGKVTEGCKILLGPKYALLQPEYASLHSEIQPREGTVKKILIYFGGVDRADLTVKAVEALLAVGSRDIGADIVLSPNSSQFQRVKNLISDRPGMHLHSKLESLAPLIATADLSIGAGGATNWERMCLGLPALIVILADNQRPIATELSRQGLVRLVGDITEAGNLNISDALKTIVEDGLDVAWSTKCLSLVDGRGVVRVISAMMQIDSLPLVLRNIDQKDESLLLDWANDLVTRQNAFNPNQILPEEHHRWFKRRLETQESCFFYIGETRSGEPCGQVRFEYSDGKWEISYVVAPSYRGYGLGRELLELSMNRLVCELGKVSLVAQVKSENVASRRIFESLGFLCVSRMSDRYVFELDLF